MSTSRVITLHYTLTDASGKVLENSFSKSPLQFLEGAGNIIPGLEQEVVSLQTGDKKVVKIAPKDAYGEKQDNLIVKADRAQFPTDIPLEVGAQFRSGPNQHDPVFTVIAIAEKEVTLDGNHPLAGQELNFDVEIMGIRAATKEELAHGHVHGPDGHHSH